MELRRLFGGEWHKMTAPTPAERKRAERIRNKAKGLVRDEVKAHAEDWPQIKALELKLRRERGI